MFKNHTKKTVPQPSNSSNLIARDTVVEGTIKAAGSLRIEGRIIGDVTANARIVLSEGAHIVGNLVARDAEIAGSIQGELTLQELLTLKSTASIEGNIVAPKLVFEHGACFNGSCKMPAQIADPVAEQPTSLEEQDDTAKTKPLNIQSA